MPRTLASLEYMVSALDAVKFFLEFCVRVFSRGQRNFVHFSHDVESTRFRMRRALLRFQLFAELFHQPGDASDSVSDWEERFCAQEVFWARYQPFEVEECKCIYYLLIVYLRSNMEDKVLGPGRDEDPIQHRGLPQLRNFIEDDAPYTRFGLSYVRRFLDRALYALLLWILRITTSCLTDFVTALSSGGIVCAMEWGIHLPGLHVRG